MNKKQLIGLKLWSTNIEDYYHLIDGMYSRKIIDYVELYIVPGTHELISTWKKLSVPFILHNAHFRHHFNLADSANEKINLEIYAETARFADELNAKYIIFHGGMEGNIEEVARQLKIINDDRALLENKPGIIPSGLKCRGSTFEEIQYVLNEVGCGLCLDFGHAVCSANFQKINPYKFISELATLNPKMFHLSDVLDMSSIYDAHPHLNTGNLNIKYLKHEIVPENGMISIETVKNSPNNLDDFMADAKYLRNI